MTVAVLMPFRASTRVRCENMWRTVAHMREVFPGVAVQLVDDLGDPFSRAGSINAGVFASDADVFVAVDADVLVSPYALRDAVDQAADPGLVQPYDEYMATVPESREKILDAEGWPTEFDVFWDARPSSRVPMLGGCNVFSRSTWEATGGMLALRGWGCQDICWATMCETLVAPTRRVEGQLIHLWHPHDDDTRRPREHNPDLMARGDVMRQLLAVRGDAAAMRLELERLGHAVSLA